MKKFLVLAACFGTVFIAYSIRYGYGILLPQMLPTLAVSKAEAGVVYSSFFVAYTVFSPLLGLMSDRYDTRWLLTFFVALLGAGAFLMAFATSILQASLFFTLAGIGSAACWAPVMALAQRWTGEKNKGKTLSFIDVGSALGIIVTSTAIPVLVVTHSWQTGWLTLGAFGFAVAALNFLVVRNPPVAAARPGGMAPRHPGEAIGTTYTRLLRDSRFWLIGLAYLLTGFSILITFTFLTTYAVQEMGFPYQTATSLLTAIGVSAIAGKLTLGPLSDKVSRVGVMMLCAGLIAAGSLGMAYGGGEVLAFLFAVIFGLGYGAAWALYAAVASDYFPRESAGSIVGLWTLFLGIGSIVSPVVSGFIADATGTLAWSFVLAAAAAVISLLLLVPLRRGRVKST